MEHRKATSDLLKSNTYLCILAGLMVACLIACGNRSNSQQRTAEEQARLSRMTERMLRLDKAALKECDSILRNTTDSLTYYDYYILLGRQKLMTDRAAEALDHARRTRTFAQKQPPSPRINGLLAMANSTEANYNHLLRRNHEHALRLNQLAYDQIMASDMLSIAPEIAANLADAYIYLDDLPNAARWYRRAMLLVDSLRLPRSKNVTLYMGLAQIYTNMEDYASAHHYYAMTERQYATMRPNMQSYYLNNYGNLLYFTGRYEQARDNFLRLKRHLEALGADRGMEMGICMVNLADVYLNLDMADSAQWYVDRAAAFFAENHVDEGSYYANAIKIGIALLRNDHAAVDRLMAQTPADDNVSQGIKNIRNKYLVAYYTQKGDYKNAFQALQTNGAENDSMAHNRTNMRSAEIMMRFTEDTLKLHHQLALRQKDAEVSKSQVRVMLATSVALILAMAMMGWYALSRRRWMRARMEIMRLRTANTRRRISPHFLFNVLNMKQEKATAGDQETMEKLTRLMRSNIDMTSQPAITLREELAFTRDYIDLERRLMGENFECNITAPPEAEQDSIMMPTMLMQILVENAIKHGIKNIQGPKRIDIDIEADSRKTTIKVADNGPGFDIRRTQGQPGKNGLYIIRQTIAITNHENRRGSRMGFNISNSTDSNGKTTGCVAVLTIPREMIYV